VRRLADHEELLHLPAPDSSPGAWMALRFSPSGRFLSAWNNHRPLPRPLWVWELKPGVRRPLLTVDDAPGGVDFSPDERTLAAALPDGSVSLFELPSGEKRRDLPPGAPAERLAFRPDGRALACASTRQPVVEVRDLSSGTIVRTLKHPA